MNSLIDSIRKISDIQIDILLIHGFPIFKYFVAMLKIFRLNFIEKKYDLIHAHYGLAGIVARVQFTIPIIVTFHGSDLLAECKKGSSKTILSSFLAKICIYINRIVSLSIIQSEEMNGKIRNTGVVIPNGVNLNIFKPLNKILCRKKLGLSKNCILILSLGNPDEYIKRIDIIKKTYSILLNQYDDIEFINPWNIPHKLVPMYMNACDVYVLTSEWEGSPSVIKEAMACNLPIVSVDVGDVKKIINDTYNCYLTSCNPIDIAISIEKVILTNERSNGRNRIIKLGLEIENISGRIIEIYNYLLK